MHAFVQLSWDTCFQVPIKDLSSFIAELGKYPKVVRHYDGQESYYYIAPNALPVVEISETPADLYKRELKEESTNA